MPKRRTPAPALTAEELEAMLETAISRADVPLTVTAAIKALPVGKKPNKEQVQIGLAKLVGAARIHQWPSKKFWSVNPESFAREQMMRTLSAGPLTEVEIKNKVPSTAKALVKMALAALVKEGTVIQHPKLGPESLLALVRRMPWLPAGSARSRVRETRKNGFQEGRSGRPA